jgi:chaperone LolA
LKTRRPATAIGAITVFVVATAVLAQNAGPAEAMVLLAKATSAYSTGAAFESPFTQIYTPAGFSTARRESGTVWVQASERLRFDYAAPDVKVFTYDGGEGRFYSPEDKQLTIHRLSPDERARLPLVFLEKPDALAERYEISRDPAGAVVLKPRAADSELSWLKLSIGASGFVDALSYQDTSGNRTEFRFEAWKAGKARPAADYHVDGPKGTRTVTQ